MKLVAYHIAQALGFRRHYFTGDLYGYGYGSAAHGCAWLWLPKVRAGTYRETKDGWRYAGYGSRL